MKSFEVNFDGLVGPTHNYAGLSDGNLASLNNAYNFSNPREAALQGLKKMKALSDLGLRQGIIAPQERPNIYALKRLGFTGNDAQVLSSAYRQAPTILSACCSASMMWVANACTVSPSTDTADGKVNITPANLTNKYHRSLEPATTSKLLKTIFSDHHYFTHHQHLPSNDHFGDEGAANHTRLCYKYGDRGVEIFTFGRFAFNSDLPKPRVFPARQTYEASQAISRLHGLSENKTIFVQQNPDVIDLGIFHNDVVAVGNQNVFLYHEQGFLNRQAFIYDVKEKFFDAPLYLIEVKTEDVSLEDVIQTYLFNSQIITLPNNDMMIIAPAQCHENSRVSTYLERLLAEDNPIKQLMYFDLNESMKNGGGPACLRLRVTLTEKELLKVNAGCLFTESLFQQLNTWVNRHYRDRLSFDDLPDPQLLIESRTALDELTQLLQLGSIYRFQQE